MSLTTLETDAMIRVLTLEALAALLDFAEGRPATHPREISAGLGLCGLVYPNRSLTGLGSALVEALTQKEPSALRADRFYRERPEGPAVVGKVAPPRKTETPVAYGGLFLYPVQVGETWEVEVVDCDGKILFVESDTDRAAAMAAARDHVDQRLH